MSYVPEFAPDARSQWRDPDIELQELVLDEMERLALNPPVPLATLVYHDLVYEDSRMKHYLFLRSVIDRQREKLTVIGIAHVANPK